MTSLSDLSKLSGYSKATISRALSGNGYVSKETRKIILGLAKELDYSERWVQAIINKNKIIVKGEEK